MRSTPQHITLTCLIGVGLCASLSADVLIFENFEKPDGSFHGDAPTINNVNSSNWSAAANMLISGNELHSAAAGSGQFAQVALGATYIVDNPAIYEITASVSFDTSSMSNTLDFMSVGFTIGSNRSNTANRNHLSPNTTSLYGAPSVGLRANGQAIVNTEQATTLYDAGSYAEDTEHTMRIVLNTTQPNWTVDAFIDGDQLDLDSGSIGMTYVYTSNPSTIAQLSISSNVDTTDQAFYAMNNIQLQTIIPEPSTYAVFLGALVGLGVMLRRRRG